MYEISIISGIQCYEVNGVAYLNLENVARGLGFTTVAASGNEVVRWNTVYKYLCDLGVATSCNGSDYRNMCPDFIPENIFYRLAMKAKNETAEKFQAKVADEVIPSIRRTGSYSVNPQVLTTADYLKAAQIVSRCTDKRLPTVISLLEKAGIHIEIPAEETEKKMLPSLNERKTEGIGKMGHSRERDALTVLWDCPIPLKIVADATGIPLSVLREYSYAQKIPTEKHTEIILKELKAKF